MGVRQGSDSKQPMCFMYMDAKRNSGPGKVRARCDWGERANQRQIKDSLDKEQRWGAVLEEWGYQGPQTLCYLVETVLFKGSSTEQEPNTCREEKQSFYVGHGIASQDRDSIYCFPFQLPFPIPLAPAPSFFL